MVDPTTGVDIYLSIVRANHGFAKRIKEKDGSEPIENVNGIFVHFQTTITDSSEFLHLPKVILLAPSLSIYM